MKAVSIGKIVLVLAMGACDSRAPNTRPGDGQEGTQASEQEATHQDDAHEEGAGTSDNRLTLSDTAVKTAGIKIDTVSLSAGVASGLVVPGQVQFDPRRVALVSPRVEGRIERLEVVEGDRVHAGQPVAFLYSAVFATAQADLIQAARRATLLAGTTDSSGAFALAAAARRRLRLLGVADSQLDRLMETGQPADFLPLTSPLDGTITESHTLPGAAVECWCAGVQGLRSVSHGRGSRGAGTIAAARSQ